MNPTTEKRTTEKSKRPNTKDTYRSRATAERREKEETRGSLQIKERNGENPRKNRRREKEETRGSLQINERNGENLRKN